MSGPGGVNKGAAVRSTSPAATGTETTSATTGTPGSMAGKTPSIPNPEETRSFKEKLEKQDFGIRESGPGTPPSLVMGDSAGLKAMLERERLLREAAKIATPGLPKEQKERPAFNFLFGKSAEWLGGTMSIYSETKKSTTRELILNWFSCAMTGFLSTKSAGLAGKIADKLEFEFPGLIVDRLTLIQALEDAARQYVPNSSNPEVDKILSCIAYSLLIKKDAAEEWLKAIKKELS